MIFSYVVGVYTNTQFHIPVHHDTQNKNLWMTQIVVVRKSNPRLVAQKPIAQPLRQLCSKVVSFYWKYVKLTQIISEKKYLILCKYS